jgi:hypothetical protein
MACRFLNDIFGPGSGALPVWGSRETLACLAEALSAGLSISYSTSKTGLSESSHARNIAIEWLQRTGRAPNDLRRRSGLSDEQCSMLGFEPKAAATDPAFSVQDMGVPSFRNLDVADLLAALRFVARYRELMAGSTGSKPVFQVGILTLTIQGREQQFFAQTLVAELGEVTDTVWLYRWCVWGLDGRYEEHWRAFDGPADASPHTTSILSSQQQIHLPSPTDYTNTPNPPYATPTTPSYQRNPKKRKPSDSTSSHSQNEPPQKRIRPSTPPSAAARYKPWQHFQHAPLSDDQLFAVASNLLQGAAILRLAHSYSNQDIFKRINATRPAEAGIKSVNVITKRISHAVKLEAEATGRSERAIRAQISEAKSLRGVAHKGKVDVTPYG